MVEKTFNLTWNNHLANLSGLFEELYKNGILTDTTLACQNGILKAHKLVLAACSPYFERVFKEHYGDQPILILKGVPMEEMECLLHFMYRGSIDVTEENLPSLISIATELEIRGLSADHQSEISNAYFNMKQDNSKSQKLNYTQDATSNSNILRSEDSNSIEHVKVEEVEVEDDPMIMDTPEDNFDASLPLTNKCLSTPDENIAVSNFPTTSVYNLPSGSNIIQSVSVEYSVKRKDDSQEKQKTKRVCKWIGSQEVEKINITEILNASAKGKSIIRYYQTNNLLNAECRSKLVQIVGDKLLAVQRNPTRHDFELIDQKIRELFPSEAQYVYFIPSKLNGKQQKNHEGKLPNYIRNVKYRCDKLEKSMAET
ncbi:zinc finger and BTB domain-containing protein 7C-like isoform X2 [Leptopilina heterotoma]|uniref:zinc finger and BTB domain-containing protein 7C-like isoform X2 n=1 Tax=Leptopilina heterotoma TaxID=63436 RepID=UPI001CA90A57|nr:zinc finger and BTB domain-containing protein 7C-like isoform X2 [Leptopilina heterotoma]